MIFYILYYIHIIYYIYYCRYTDTWVFPLVQRGLLDIYHDSEITLKLLQTAPMEAMLRLATGYFNYTSDYIQALLRSSNMSSFDSTSHCQWFFYVKLVKSLIQITSIA